ncbi:hypothetical protein A3K01_01155 [candidate division WWE3 bacterium RIFOXYD1_FULL_43_17]|uniref:Uncharacterized protein n=3 Tax=Katanobacteria TaxID=422282 RepID=A0A1F4XB62_UNCKA|nr:MAG: hypothetical protein UU59_C0004G0020 [candidate division WWE3 bacterium GW2011_GWE1_41_27]KKS60576.1 MAG: hypothetical protein UV26_C0003G0030 [candidate division WWE3 bacterium GW2011_GWF2_42_42]OGC78912.1 MAG: hypothetical protein A3K01_01155 [candidate division WWE3 bacterium RIFOXYD1_FULL_43_17]
MGTKELEEIDGMHGRWSYFTAKTTLTNYKNVHKVRGGYYQADKVITTQIPPGSLFVGLHCLNWDETFKGIPARANLYPAYQDGVKAWVLIYTFNFDCLLLNERILDFETGKELWLKNTNRG